MKADKIGKVFKKTLGKINSGIKKAGETVIGTNEPTAIKKFVKWNKETAGKIKNFSNKVSNITHSGAEGLANNTMNHKRTVNKDKLIGFEPFQAIKKDVLGATNIVETISSPLVKRSSDSILGVKVNKKGVAAAMGVSLVTGSNQAAKSFNERTIGTQRDSQITPHAPRIPAYANNGGATGDLVFALNANRKG